MGTSRQQLVFLAGPTASGKTDIAIALAERFAMDIVSVDSAMVYRYLDIGSAKPDAATLQRAPHRLVDIREPEETYSAGDFKRDAIREIQSIWDAGRTPLLTGGTLLYFRALKGGLANLPGADLALRALLDQEAKQEGWPALHRRLADIDAPAAERISPNDGQRIQRALEVYELSGRPLSELQRANQSEAAVPMSQVLDIALYPGDRGILHKRIECRFEQMLADGFLDEVQSLMQRPKLSSKHASMRCVGYRQLWEHLAGDCSLEVARQRAMAATRQLAKRQLSWIRGDDQLIRLDPLETDVIGRISSRIEKFRG